MNQKPPKLSIGLPVFNGGRFLDELLWSLRRQSFGDYELIIADNASVDDTRDICVAHAREDSRISYYRHERNIGATQNWFDVLSRANGEYFASAAHDDVYESTYMQRCIEVLESDASVVLCYSKTSVIDERGAVITSGPAVDALARPIDTMSPLPHVRFYNAITVDLLCIQLYGVMRTRTIKGTFPYAGYYGCDRNTLAELAIRGKLFEVAEPLFRHRVYPDALGAAAYSGKSESELARVDPGTQWRMRFPSVRVYLNYLRAIARSGLSLDEAWHCAGKVSKTLTARVKQRIA